MLRSAGHAVTLVGNGEQALDALESGAVRPRADGSQHAGDGRPRRGQAASLRDRRAGRAAVRRAHRRRDRRDPAAVRGGRHRAYLTKPVDMERAAQPGRPADAVRASADRRARLRPSAAGPAPAPAGACRCSTATLLERLRQLDDQDGFVAGLIKTSSPTPSSWSTELEAAALQRDAATLSATAPMRCAAAPPTSAPPRCSSCASAGAASAPDELAAEGAGLRARLEVGVRALARGPPGRPRRARAAGRDRSQPTALSAPRPAPACVRAWRRCWARTRCSIRRRSASSRPKRRLHPHVGHVDQLLVADRLATLAHPAQRAAACRGAGGCARDTRAPRPAPSPGSTTRSTRPISSSSSAS